MLRLAFRLLLVVLPASLALATPATAGGPTDPVGGETALGSVAGLKYLSETLAVGSSGHYGTPYDAAWMACGPHTSTWHTTAGGSKIAGNQADNHISTHRAMDLDSPFEVPDDFVTDDWWESVVWSVPGRSLTGHAICTKAAVKYRSVITPDASGPARSGSANCPSGWTLIGGGGFIATSGSWINSSYPAKNNTWKVRINDVIGGIGGMSTSVQCRRAGDVAKVSRTGSTMTSGHASTVTALCAPGRHVIGGGAKLSGPIAEAHLAASFPIDGSDADTIPDDGWRVIGYNDSGAGKTVTAYALCVTHA